MSEDSTAVVSSGARRPVSDQIFVHAPFLGDLALAGVNRLDLGSRLRKRLVIWVQRRGIAAVNRGDMEALGVPMEPDLEISLFGAAGLGLSDHYSGRQGMRDFFAELYANSATTPRWTLKRVRDAGSCVVGEFDYAMRGEVSGAEVVLTYAAVFYFSPRGRIARWDVFWQDGWKQALEAAGLSE
jgi:hypothetical protein